MGETNVKYFDKPGEQNTNATIDAVCSYVQQKGEVAAIIVASISGRTALKLSASIPQNSVPIVCVSGSPSWCNHPEYKFPLIDEQTRKELLKSKVVIVDSCPSSLHDTVDMAFARYGYRPPVWMFIETLLAVGGYGLKTAVECIMMATDGGYIPAFKEVLAIGGTGKGADTAIVARSSFASTVFAGDPEKRFVLHEILAMPRNKHYWKSITMGDWTIEETK